MPFNLYHKEHIGFIMNTCEHFYHIHLYSFNV